MTALYLANVLVLVVVAWALWERRLAFQSKWDAPITWGILLFGMGAALDSPWPGISAASYPLTHKYYLLMALGHICYLSGAAMGIKSIYLRLVPDDAIGPFMTRRILPAVAIASAVMLTSLVASPISSSMPEQHLYLVGPDGWLTLYWLAFLGTLTGLEIVSIFGLLRLRTDPRSVMLNLLIASQVVGTLACLAIGFGVLNNRDDIARTLVWPFAYAGIIGGAIAAVVAWRHRVVGLTTAPRD